MRTRSAIKNGVISLLSYLILMISTLIIRKLFVTHFDIELLGYDGVINNILSLMSVSELGVAAVISYQLYRKLENKDESAVAKLMSIYQYIYRIIGILVFIIGCIIAILLPAIIVEEETNWVTVYVIYSIRLAVALSTYFLAFRRVLYTTTQQGYVCTIVDLICNLFGIVLQVISIVWINSFVIYLSVSFITALLSNIIISARYIKDFPYAVRYRVSLNDLKNYHFFRDIKTYIPHRVAALIYSSTDNIVISRFLGVYTVALYTNYFTINTFIASTIFNLIGGVKASIGSLVYDSSKSRQDHWQIYNGIDLLGYFAGSFIATCYLTLYQPFITLWLGKEYLLPFSFVIVVVMNEYLRWNTIFLAAYREVLGHYGDDMWYMIISAIVNLFISITSIPLFGISGVVLGTVIGNLIITFGRMNVVLNTYLNDCAVIYLKKQLLKICTAGMAAIITYSLSQQFEITYIGLIQKICLCLFIPNIINAVIYLPSNDALFIRNKVSDLLKKHK